MHDNDMLLSLQHVHSCNFEFNYVTNYKNQTADNLSLLRIFSHQKGKYTKQTSFHLNVNLETFTTVMFQVEVFWVMMLCSIVFSF
jgi:hypothetical protein